MRWFSKTKQAEVWDEAIEWPIGDIEAAHRIREICRAAASIAEKIAGSADRSHKKLGPGRALERAARIAMEIAIRIPTILRMCRARSRAVPEGDDTRTATAISRHPVKAIIQDVLQGIVAAQ